MLRKILYVILDQDLNSLLEDIGSIWTGWTLEGIGRQKWEETCEEMVQGLERENVGEELGMQWSVRKREEHGKVGF